MRVCAFVCVRVISLSLSLARPTIDLKLTNMRTAGKAKKETTAEKRARIERQAEAKKKCVTTYLPIAGITITCLMLLFFTYAQ